MWARALFSKLICCGLLVLFILPEKALAGEDTSFKPPYRLMEDSRSILQHYDLEVLDATQANCEALLSGRRNAIARFSLKDLNTIPDKTAEYRLRREFLVDALEWVRWVSPQYFNLQKVLKLHRPTQQLCIQTQSTDRKLKRISALFLVGRTGLDRKLLQIVFPYAPFNSNADITIVLTSKKTSDAPLFYLKEVFFTFDPYDPEMTDGSVMFANIMQHGSVFNGNIFTTINIFLVLLLGAAVTGLVGGIFTIIHCAKNNPKNLTRQARGIRAISWQLLTPTKFLFVVAVLELVFVLLLYCFSFYFKGKLFLYFGFRFTIFAFAIMLVMFDDFINRKFVGQVETGWSTPKQVFNTIMIKKFSVTGSTLMLAITIQINKELGYIISHIFLACLIFMIFSVRKGKANWKTAKQN